MGQVYNTKTVFSIAFLLYTALIACFGAENAPSRAILEVGTLSSAGVPGFGPNRIPCLYGRYAMGPSLSIEAFAVSEAVLFDPARWNRNGTGNQTRWIALADNRRIIAAARKIPSSNPSSVNSDWHFVLSFPLEMSDADCLAFFALFTDRVTFFFSSAKSNEALSFPALINLPTGR